MPSSPRLTKHEASNSELDIDDTIDPNIQIRPTSQAEPGDTIAVMPRALCWAVQVPLAVQLHDPHNLIQSLQFGGKMGQGEDGEMEIHQCMYSIA